MISIIKEWIKKISCVWIIAQILQIRMKVCKHSVVQCMTSFNWRIVYKSWSFHSLAWLIASERWSHLFCWKFWLSSRFLSWILFPVFVSLSKVFRSVIIKESLKNDMFSPFQNQLITNLAFYWFYIISEDSYRTISPFYHGRIYCESLLI